MNLATRSPVGEFRFNLDHRANRSNFKIAVLITVLALSAWGVSCNSISSDPILSDNHAMVADPSAQNAAALGQDSLPCFSKSASLVGLSETSVMVSGNGSIGGSVVLLGGSSLQASGNARISDHLFVRSSSQVASHGHASIGAIVESDYSDRESAIFDFAHDLEKLHPTQVVEEIVGNQVIQGSGRLNVISVRNGIKLSGDAQLVLAGADSDQFIFLVEHGGIELSGKAKISTQGVFAKRVLFSILDTSGISLTGQASATGSYLASEGAVMISGKGTLIGAFVGKGSIQISGNGLSLTPAAFCPEIQLPAPPSSGSEGGSGGSGSSGNGDSGSSTGSNSGDSSGGSSGSSGFGSGDSSDSGSGSSTPDCEGLGCGVLGV